MWNTYDTCLTCAKLGQAGKAMHYIKGELKPHYPVPATYNHIDRMMWEMGYRATIKVIVALPFVANEWGGDL